MTTDHSILSNTNLMSALNADALEIDEELQTLWSGYGKIIRLKVINGTKPSAVIKYIQVPKQVNHPRGWNTDVSHQRKVDSYIVEERWYQNWASRKLFQSKNCRIAELYWAHREEESTVLVLEDLDAAGYKWRVSNPNYDQMCWCLRWLANFHAEFLNDAQSLEACDTQLWERGTYWHLATRQDEWQAMQDSPLKSQAEKIDSTLRAAKFKTIVHGDAKIANFCFNQNASAVAAVDFQYVGAGCGIQDVALYFSSCLNSDDCAEVAPELLTFYFGELTAALKKSKPEINARDLEEEWRYLYSFAWADFARFLEGWNPGHWKLHDYCQQQVNLVVESLNNGSQRFS